EPRAQDGVFRIGTARSLEGVYGIDLLIEAFALARKEAKTPLELVIVGGGSGLSRYRRLAGGRGGAAEVVFTGALPHQELPARFRQWDVFVSPSRSEGFGVAVLEAAACGVPSVVTRVGGLPEIVQDGSTGLVVAPESARAIADALLRLI